MLTIDFTFEELLALFRKVLSQLGPEERWRLLRELAREELETAAAPAGGTSERTDPPRVEEVTGPLEPRASPPAEAQSPAPLEEPRASFARDEPLLESPSKPVEPPEVLLTRSIAGRRGALRPLSPLSGPPRTPVADPPPPSPPAGAATSEPSDSGAPWAQGLASLFGPVRAQAVALDETQLAKVLPDALRQVRKRP